MEQNYLRQIFQILDGAVRGADAALQRLKEIPPQVGDSDNMRGRYRRGDTDLHEAYREVIGGRTYVAISSERRTMVVEEESTDAWFFDNEGDAQAATHLAQYALRKAKTKT